MTCFTLQSRTSDYLEGTLSESLKREAEDHLGNCKECHARHRHYRLILAAIANQPKSTLPALLKKSPLTNPLPRGPTSQPTLIQWESIPWLLRTLIEGVGIVVFILFGTYSAPKIRALYEKNIDKSLTDFHESTHLNEILPDTVDPVLPPLQENPVNLSGSQAGDDISGEDDSEDDDDVHVGRSQLWRFTLKTVSPDELRPQVVKALTEAGVPLSLPGLGGIQVPGGIEFDLVLPQSSVPNIKHFLQKMAPPPFSDKVNSPSGSENFTWYRVKSKRKLPEGTSQVVIWLSQPN